MHRALSNIFWHSKKKDFVVKTRDMVSFLPLINNSVTSGLSFLLISITTIISPKTTNILHLLFGLYSSMFL